MVVRPRGLSLEGCDGQVLMDRWAPHRNAEGRAVCSPFLLLGEAARVWGDRWGWKKGRVPHGWEQQEETSTGKCPPGGSTTQEIRLEAPPHPPQSYSIYLLSCCPFLPLPSFSPNACTDGDFQVPSSQASSLTCLVDTYYMWAFRIPP